MNTYTSQDPTYGRTFLKSVLAAYAARPAAALVAAPKLRLSMDPAFNPTPDSVIADLTGGEANFTGYTAGGYDPALVGPYNQAVGYEAEYGHVIAVGSGGGPFTGNSLYGYWIDDGTNVVMFERFQNANPFTIVAPGDAVEIDLRMPLPLQATLN